MEEVKAAGFDELVRELLDDESPLFYPPEKTTETKISPTCDELAMNQLISTSYLGPTIQDTENVWAITSQKDQSLQAAVSQARIAMLERGLSEMENNKYTLKLKGCGDGMVDDGYKWRKYGQKSIKNSPYPRSYYRCTNPRCSAKKQVERSREDKDTLVITYEGLHLHFASPYFQTDQPHRINSLFKKPRRDISGAESKSPEAQEAVEVAEESLASESPAPLICTLEGPRQELGSQTMGPQGLLEDVVPFMIRNPPTNIASSYSSSSSSYRSPPASPSSQSWSPNYPYSCFDISMNHR